MVRPPADTTADVAGAGSRGGRWRCMFGGPIRGRTGFQKLTYFRATRRRAHVGPEEEYRKHCAALERFSNVYIQVAGRTESRPVEQRRSARACRSKLRPVVKFGGAAKKRFSPSHPLALRAPVRRGHVEVGRRTARKPLISKPFRFAVFTIAASLFILGMAMQRPVYSAVGCPYVDKVVSLIPLVLPRRVRYGNVAAPGGERIHRTLKRK
jgi:hypothetical protein